MKYKCLNCGAEFEAKISVTCTNCGERIRVHSVPTPQYAHKAFRGRNVKKWYERAKKILEQGDEFLKCYLSRMNGKYGWFIISYRRVLFLREIGFIHKDYSLIFDKKRDNIKYVCKEGSHGLSIYDSLENVSRFTFDLPSEIIFEYLEKWVKAPILMHEHATVLIHD